MAPGLVGLGLGGLFYILSALGVGVVEVAKAVRARNGRRWAFALRHAAIAWLTLLAVGCGIVALVRTVPPIPGARFLPSPGPEWVDWIVVPTAALASVLVVVSVAALVVPPSSAHPLPDPLPESTGSAAAPEVAARGATTGYQRGG